MVYFIRPLGVQSMAMSTICPAVTIECGKPEHKYGMTHARDYIDACLHLSELPQHPVASHDIDLFHTVATVKVPDSMSFGFGEADADLRLLSDIDHLNFRELPAGSRLGWLRDGVDGMLDVRDDNDQQVFERYFRIEDGVLTSTSPFMPSMLDGFQQQPNRIGKVFDISNPLLGQPRQAVQMSCSVAGVK